MHKRLSMTIYRGGVRYRIETGLFVKHHIVLQSERAVHLKEVDIGWGAKMFPVQKASCQLVQCYEVRASFLSSPSQIKSMRLYGGVVPVVIREPPKLVG